MLINSSRGCSRIHFIPDSHSRCFTISLQDAAHQVSDVRETASASNSITAVQACVERIA